MKKLLHISLLMLCLPVMAQQKEQFTAYFDTDATEPTEASKAEFEQWLKDNSNARIEAIEAYTDTIGGAEYNRILSINRAKYFVVRFASLHKLQTWAMRTPGETEFKGGTNAENRKAVITYIKPTAKPEPVSELKKEVTAAKKGDKLKLKNLNFYGNSGKVLPESEPILDDLLKVMQDNRKLRIDIQGHICCQFNDPDGIAKMRAESVYNYLIENGVDKKRLKCQSFGGTKPLHRIPEQSSREQIENRRVEIEILDN